MKKILLFLASASLGTSQMSFVLSCTNSENRILEQLLNFRQIDYTNIDNIPVLRQMQEDVIFYRNSYLTKIQDTFKNKYEEFYDLLLKQTVLDVAMNQNTKVGTKSGLTDSVYLGQQAMGYYYPQATELHEINRYEIPNYDALEAAGYTLYINNSNKEKLKIVNLDESNTLTYNGLDFVALTNDTKTDCVYFQTTTTVSSSTANGSSEWRFIAVKNQDLTTVKITNKNEYNKDFLTVTITNANPEISKSYLEYKMGDWLRYEFVNNINVQAFELTNVLLSYVELTGNFLSQLEAIKYNSYNLQKVELLNGMYALAQQKYDGVSSGASLYVISKYAFNFELFTIMQNDSETVINFFLDQNQDLNVTISDDLENDYQAEPQRELLNFNPYLKLNQKIVNFAQKVWQLYFKLDKMQVELLLEQEK